jgi:hypothetical protein
LKTSTQTTVISAMISHAAALPTQVLMPSIACRMLWTLIHCRRRCEEKLSTTKHHSVTLPNGALPVQRVVQIGFLAFGPQ